MAAVTERTKKFLQEVGKGNNHWDILYSPRDKVPVSGIYRCNGCGREITSNANDSFPPQNHHQHPERLGINSIKWQLIVRTDTHGDNFGISR